MIISAVIAEMANHAKNQPWPSLEWAGWIFDRASFVLVGSLIVGACATIAIVWMGIVKEHHWDLLREQANREIASVGLEAAKSNAEAAKAHERIAELSTQGDQLKKDTADANARALESKLELEKFRAFRTLTTEQQARIAEQLKQFAGVQFDGAWASMDAELDFLFSSIEASLIDAGWKSIPFVGQGFVFGRSTKSAVGMANVFGVVINVPDTTNSQLLSAAYALVIALSKEGIGAVVQDKVGFVSANPDTIHILIGAKH